MKKLTRLSLADWGEIADITREIDNKIGELHKKTAPALSVGDVSLIVALQQKHLLKVRSILEDRMLGQVDQAHQDREGHLLRLFFGQDPRRDAGDLK